MKPRAALAILLFVATALIVAPKPLPPPPPEPEQPSSQRGPTPQDIPADCTIIASEAAARLAACGSWVRMVHVVILTREGKIGGHCIVVWQPPTCRHVLAYDLYMVGGSIDTGVESHDLKKIIVSLSRLTHIRVFEAHFVA